MSSQTETQDGAGVQQSGKDTLSVTDNRTGRTYEIEITDGTVRAMDFRQMKVDDEDFGLMSYDPAFTNTASCRSAITFIDGDKGILRYRGYDVSELAEKSSFIECAYLILNGELPTKSDLDKFTNELPSKPSLYLQGLDDGCMTAELVRDAEKVMAPGSIVVRYPGVGHFLQLEDPDGVSDLIADYLGSPS